MDSGQLLACQQKHSAATAFEIEPGERYAWKAAPQRAFRVAHLDHQQAARTQVMRGPVQDDPDRIETFASGLEREPWFVTVLARQAAHLAHPHVGRIARDDIVGFPGKCREVIGLDELHAGC
jgi:hypothetical protein